MHRLPQAHVRATHGQILAHITAADDDSHTLTTGVHSARQALRLLTARMNE